MYFIGQDVDIVETEHIHHEDQAFFDGFFVEMFDFGLFPVFIKVTDFFESKLAVIGILEQFFAELTLNMQLYLIQGQIGNGDLAVLDVIIEVILQGLPDGGIVQVDEGKMTAQMVEKTPFFQIDIMKDLPQELLKIVS